MKNLYVCIPNAVGYTERNENIMQDEDEVKFLSTVKVGQDVRQPKSDMSSGMTILEAGQVNDEHINTYLLVNILYYRNCLLNK